MRRFPKWVADVRAVTSIDGYETVAFLNCGKNVAEEIYLFMSHGLAAAQKNWDIVILPCLDESSCAKKNSI